VDQATKADFRKIVDAEMAKRERMDREADAARAARKMNYANMVQAECALYRTCMEAQQLKRVAQ